MSRTTSCIYEVKVEVENPVAEEYLLWLRSHINDIVEAAGFIKAEIFICEEAPKGHRVWVIHYHAADKSQIDAYLNHLAPRFRADGLSRFGNRFRAERRILIFQS